MQIIVHDGADLKRIDVTDGQTVLAALQSAHMTTDAPCGGIGCCKKCRVLVSDDRGVSYRLACQTPVSDGMEVTVERNRNMNVSMGSNLCSWPADGAIDTWGLAIDVGTTTVVCRLHELSNGRLLDALGCSNPQIVFGADVLSRISASDVDGVISMQELLGDTLVDMAEELIERHGIEKCNLAHAVLCGNTTMEHLALAIDPTPLGVSPFVPPTLFGDVRVYEPFARTGIAEGKVLFAPCIAAYVGGDITAGMLAMRMHEASAPMLLIDLGTNGEMALGDARGITCCATAAGPVFEGANVKYGMPAYPGAISRVTLADDGTLAFTIIGKGGIVDAQGASDALGICGTGLFDTVALLLTYGIVDETGRMLKVDEIDTARSRGLEHLLTEEDGQPAFRLTDRISITQADVRNLQLAKASVCAGALTLMDAMGYTPEDISELLIAGGFGEYLDLASAARVGIFPSELLPRARSVGNTAIEGASALVVSSEARASLHDIVERSSYIELSTSAVFNELYIEQMEFE